MRTNPGEVTEESDNGNDCHGMWLEGESRQENARKNNPLRARANKAKAQDSSATARLQYGLAASTRTVAYLSSSRELQNERVATGENVRAAALDSLQTERGSQDRCG